MTSTARNIYYQNDGMKTADFNHSLQHLSDQIRLIEQKLTMRVDENISYMYHFQHTMIEKIQTNIDLVNPGR
ncbi:hypothetical protein ABRT01_00895 [Lentibacillus sp. L22]|uniref:hypothetical protein n=1 Tax=Lentibacillus sp. L22 TaxID=3163028 RepID=UPI0034678C1C